MIRKRELSGLERRKIRAGYLFTMPFTLGFFIFMVRPLFQSLYMSISNVDVSAGGFKVVITGLVNYFRAFTVDIEFNRLLVEEITRMCINAPAIIVFSFFTALILNQKFKGRGIVRVIFFLPVILSSGVILGVEYNNALLASMQDMIAQSDTGTSITGAIQNILMTSGVGVRAFSIVFGIVNGIYDVAISSGIQIIIFLSGLQTIPNSMYEAASIEGCTAWEKLWKITFPMISPLFLVNWVYTIVDFCMRSDNLLMEKIREEMVVQINYGFSSAMAWIYFVIVIVVIGISSFIISKGVYYYDE